MERCNAFTNTFLKVSVFFLSIWFLLHFIFRFFHFVIFLSIYIRFSFIQLSAIYPILLCLSFLFYFSVFRFVIVSVSTQKLIILNTWKRSLYFYIFFPTMPFFFAFSRFFFAVTVGILCIFNLSVNKSIPFRMSYLINCGTKMRVEKDSPGRTVDL